MNSLRAQFISRIFNELEDGCGFVPLIGSGISVASGISTGQGLVRELFPQIKAAADGHWKRGEKHNWGGGDSDKGDNSRQAWLKKQLKRIAKFASATRKAKHDDLHASLRTVSASLEWLDAVDFLSRADSPDNKTLVLRPPDSTTIDDLFNYLTDGKKPNLAHSMVAHLADSLRMHIILTTNFDDLIEQAFERLHSPLKCFPVHLNAILPAPQIVLQTRSLIKLHGAGYGLRANDSINTCPTLEDLNAFDGYFCHDATHITGSVGSDASPLSHLLVMGYSGSDRRIMTLLAHSMWKRRDMKVYWLRYKHGRRRDTYVNKSRNDIAGLICNAQQPGFFLDGADVESRVYVEHISDLGLFLYDLYQRLHHALPPAGATYSAISQIPGATSGQSDAGKSALSNLNDQCKWLKDEIVAREEAVIPVMGGYGVTLVASSVFDDLRQSQECLWLDLSRFRRFEDFRVSLLEAVAAKLGRSREVGRTPIGLKNEDFRTHIQQLASKSSKPFLVFVSGREGLGTCGGWRGEERAKEFDASALAADFWNGIDELAAGQTFLRFVALCREQSDKHSSRAFLLPRGRRPIPLEPTQKRSGTQVAEDVVDWLKGRADQRMWQFVYALTLFRRSRPIAALSSWGVLKAPYPGHVPALDNDAARAKEGAGLLRILNNKLHALRVKDGGLVWMFDGVRHKISAQIESLWDRQGFDTPCVLQRAITHQGLADWYAKLFRSSNDPLAAGESIYHRFQACVHATRFYVAAKDTSKAEFTPTTRDMDPKQLACTSALEAMQTLRSARGAFLSRGHLDDAEELISAAKEVNADLSVFGCTSVGRRLVRECIMLVGDLYRRSANFERALSFYETVDSDNSFILPEESRYFQAVCLIGLRSYERAFDYLGRVVQDILGDAAAITEHHASSTPSLAGVTRKTAETWAAAHVSDQETLQHAVRAMARFMALQLLDAQAEQLQVGVEDAEAFRRSQARFKIAEITYMAVTTMMRFIEDLTFLNRYNAKIRTLYGVLLGNLNCTFEAHRRLNEAAAYLEAQNGERNGIGVAIIALRRAEVFLREAERAIRALDDNVDGDSRKACARIRYCVSVIGEARSCLALAKSQLTGHRSYAWWWTLYYELELQACADFTRLLKYAVVHNISGVLEPGHVDVDYAKTLLNEGRAFIWRDIFRLARLIDLSSQAGVATADCDGAMIQLDRMYKERTGPAFHECPIDERLNGIIFKTRSTLGIVVGNARSISAATVQKIQGKAVHGNKKRASRGGKTAGEASSGAN